MRILYGVAGEGYGHSSRAAVITDYLQKKGHKVVIMTYGQAYNVLKNKFKVFKVKGLHLFFEKSVLNTEKTIFDNIRHFTKNFLRWKKFYKLMQEFKPELCISDMEPIVPILRNWYKLPLICIDNQHRITNLDIEVPKKYYQDYLTAKAVVDSFVKRADYFLVLSFANVKINKRDTIILPPIIREEIKKIKNKAKYGDKILVYLTKKDKYILEELKAIRENFAVYGYDKKGKQGNIEFKTKETFLQDLKDCKAIIATSGFTLISEALYLKKPYLALPLKGQFEQTLNALFLKKAGFGDYTENLNEKEIIYFLHKLDFYKKNLQNYKADCNKIFKVLDKILKEFKKKQDN